jgi:GTP-binding protein HflX
MPEDAVHPDDEHEDGPMRAGSGSAAPEGHGLEPDTDESSEEESHRGGFGEFGGESGGLIERTFRERIVLVGVTLPGETEEDTDAALDELELLVDTAGADVVDRVVQRRTSPDSATYIGKGKADEVRLVAEALDADTVVFDDELSPTQGANLTKLLGRTAIDRTAVILDIFAQNAHSQEGRAQIELALLRYRLPRLRGRGKSLSQQTGAIGFRGGPGETQLEIDRRRILRRIQKLERELREINAHRRVQRKSRRRTNIPTVAIVGYTNAGKSTLLNRLTDAGVLVEDRLFATLDTTTRRLVLPNGEQVLLIDTVGFVRKLPHHLVEAFRSTLEVVAEADLLVHLVDGSSADTEGNIMAVRDVLTEIGAGEVPELMVVNKADALDPAGRARLGGRYPDALLVSARTGDGIEALIETLADRVHRRHHVLDLLVPYERGDVLAAAHRSGEVLSEEAGEGGMTLRVRVDDRGAARLAEFALAGVPSVPGDGPDEAGPGAGLVDG